MASQGWHRQTPRPTRIRDPLSQFRKFEFGFHRFNRVLQESSNYVSSHTTNWRKHPGAGVRVEHQDLGSSRQQGSAGDNGPVFDQDLAPGAASVPRGTGAGRITFFGPFAQAGSLDLMSCESRL